MKRIVITMRSYKKFISSDLLQLALLISLLKVDPDNYLGLQPHSGPDTGGGVLLGSQWSDPLLPSGGLHPGYPGPKSLNSLLERYQEDILEDLNNLGRFTRFSMYGGVPIQLSAYLVDTDPDFPPCSDGGYNGDSDSGISDTEAVASPSSATATASSTTTEAAGSPTPSSPDSEKEKNSQVGGGARCRQVGGGASSQVGGGASSANNDDSDHHMDFDEEDDDDDDAIFGFDDDNVLYGRQLGSAASAVVIGSNNNNNNAVANCDRYPCVVEEEELMMFGPSIPAELAGAGIPDIEDHGAIQYELLHMEEQLMNLEYDISEMDQAFISMDSEIAKTFSEEEEEEEEGGSVSRRTEDGQSAEAGGIVEEGEEDMMMLMDEDEAMLSLAVSDSLHLNLAAASSQHLHHHHDQDEEEMLGVGGAVGGSADSDDSQLLVSGASPFDDWEREAYAELADLLHVADPLEVIPPPPLLHHPPPPPLPPAAAVSDSQSTLVGGADADWLATVGQTITPTADDTPPDWLTLADHENAVSSSSFLSQTVDGPESLDDFDLDLFDPAIKTEEGGVGAGRRLFGLAEEEGGCGAVKNDVMFTAVKTELLPYMGEEGGRRVNSSEEFYQGGSDQAMEDWARDVGFLLNQTSTHQEPSVKTESSSPVDLFDGDVDAEMAQDLIAQVLKESEIDFTQEVKLESVKKEEEEDDDIVELVTVKEEVKEEEEEVLLEEFVEVVVPTTEFQPGFELDSDGACAQIDGDSLYSQAASKGIVEFTLSRHMTQVYQPRFNLAGFTNDHSSYSASSGNQTDSPRPLLSAAAGAISASAAAASSRRRNESESSGYLSAEDTGSSSSSFSRPSRDEKLAAKMGLPYSARHLIDCSMERFNEYLNNPKLSKEQVKLCKDIRRRGKNKVAAQNCRRRKMETIEELQTQVESVRRRRAALLLERERLETERRRWSGKLEIMEQRVLAGLGKNMAQFTLQVNNDRVRVTARLTSTVGGGLQGKGGGGKREN